MRVFLSAGEASGDALGAALLGAFADKGISVQGFGMGGPLLRAAGLEVWRDAHEVAVFGLVEVLGHLPRLFRLVGELATRAIAQRPDVAILIDVPDFHVRLAKRLTAAGIPVVTYVGPSVWAWRSGRARRYAPHLRRLLVLFPFELPVWQAAGVDVVCVGHPLADEIQEALPWALSEPKTVTLLPGSRRSEIARVLEPMLGAARQLRSSGDANRFLLPVAPGLDRSLVEDPVARSGLPIELVDGTSVAARRDAVGRASAAMLASGTISLEVALLGRPQVLTYRVHPLTWRIARPMIKLEHVGLANLVAGTGIAPELLQNELTAERLAEETRRVLRPEGREQALLGIARVRERLGPPGAAGRAADAVLEVVRAPSGLATSA
ncbi:MAG: lipid-A-disaccharide synthase [Deltaproteobacteria bacterium]|nr:lipid-A-disaccharide synthase [Deltaproteobacteria bacterium]